MEQCGQQLASGGPSSRRALTTHLLTLWEFALIEAATITKCLQVGDTSVGCHTRLLQHWGMRRVAVPCSGGSGA